MSFAPSASKYLLSTSGIYCCNFDSVHADINDSTRNDPEEDAEDDADDEDLFQLASEKNEEATSSVDSKEEDEEAEGVEEPPEGHSDRDSPVIEQLSQQRVIVEDIRFFHFKFQFKKIS